MAYSLDELVQRAREAGGTAGTATDRVRSALEDAVSSGFTKYDSIEVAQMRTAYVAASKAAAAGDPASQARAKAAAHNMFSRAWDSLVADGRADARPNKGKGRNAKVKSDAADDAADESDVAAPGKVLTAADVPDAIKAEILRDGLVALLAKCGAVDALRLAEENIECFTDTNKAIEAGRKSKATQAERDKAASNAREYLKDAVFAYKGIAKALESIAVAAGVVAKRTKAKQATAPVANASSQPTA